MNKTVLLGRLTRDPEVRYSQGESPGAIARYTLAVQRRTKRDEADFISCVAFGKAGEFAERYLRKGMKICVSGRIQTGSYVKQDGTKVYTTDVVVEEHEFTQSSSGEKGSASDAGEDALQTSGNAQETDNSGFMQIPEGIEEEFPFV